MKEIKNHNWELKTETDYILEPPRGALPVHIITGFLGSGKTTAIIDLLNQKKSDDQWAVIINEFGKASIDTQTVEKATENQNIFDISGGCICCSAKAFFQLDLEEIVNLQKFSRIIIEPSGLGGIDMVTEIVAKIPQLALLPVICMVDITLLNNERLQMNFLYKNQISKADYIAFSKCDTLIDSEIVALLSKFESKFPNKTIVDKSQLLKLICLENQPEKIRSQLHLLHSQNKESQDNNFRKKTLTFEPETIFDSEKLSTVLKSYPQLLRAKGYIRTENGCQLMNYTLSGCSFENHISENQNEILLITEQVENDFFQQIETEIKLAILTN
ncbi:MAG: hypothetical protein GZ091_08465 [Paludibacter sp.]|nr:hypothetical protein [Paludibacter sp.]